MLKLVRTPTPIANVQKPGTDLGGAGHVNASGGLILALHGCVKRLKKILLPTCRELYSGKEGCLGSSEWLFANQEC